MKKLANVLFVVLCICSSVLFGQGLEIIDPGIASAEPITLGGEETIQYVAIKNNSVENAEIFSLSFYIDAAGQIPCNVLKELRIYKETVLLASQYVTNSKTVGDVFLNPALCIMWPEIKIGPLETVMLAVKGTVLTPAKIRITLVQVVQKKGQSIFLSAVGDVKYSKWRDTNPKFSSEGKVKLYPEEKRIIAPNSKNIRIGMNLEIPVGKSVYAIDAVAYNYRDITYTKKIFLNNGIDLNYLEMIGWNGELRSNEEESMLILYGLQGIDYEQRFFVHMGINGKFTQGDKIPFMFNVGNAVYKIGTTGDAMYCEEREIEFGPDVTFGDPLNIGVVNAANMVYCLNAFYGCDGNINEQELLRITLSADVNGNGYIDNDDFYHMLEMAYDKYYTPPILYTGGGVGKQLTKVQKGNTHPIITKEKNGATEVFLSTPVRSCELKVTAPAGTMIQKGSALNSKFSHIGKRNGKEDLLFATRDGLDVSKPILVIATKSSNIKIEGVVDDGVPIGVNSVNGVGDNNTLAPTEFTLLQNYPNPFNPSTKIVYSIPQAEKVELKVYDVLGKEVATIVNEVKAAGKHEVMFNASSIPSGVYFYTIKAGEYNISKKMVIMK